MVESSRILLVTGSSGLIGSEVVKYFCSLGWFVYGVDNNQREVFFGPKASTRQNQKYLEEMFPTFTHIEVDIRDRKSIFELYQNLRPNAVVHTAAQPSHDRAAAIPFDDFETNAVGTLNLLEAHKSSCKDSPFVHLSTNKVYGDKPNIIPRIETSTRYDYDDQKYLLGIDESFSIDQSKHSIFGASKLAADILVQEYGRYFGIPTCCLRGGCLTGPAHAGVELHGFLSYIVKCGAEGTMYNVYGYKGKQVRDNIHSRDVVSFISHFIHKPRVAEVYNIGGGKDNSISILEVIEKIEALTCRSFLYEYVDKNRAGDHIVYYSNLAKCCSHYPDWGITFGIDDILLEIYEAHLQTL